MQNLWSQIAQACLFILISTLFSPQTKASSEQKLNICTITINSDNERTLFKKYLNPQNVNHIELTDFATETERTTYQDDQSKWFKRACESGVQCDVLVISGHFSNAFFSNDPDKKISLPIDAMTQSSCNHSCDGILKKPKEVLLSGCNTLAIKGEEHRTPEQLFNQLVNEDGYTTAQASASVSLLFSPFGENYRERFQKIFSETPRIYGFSNRSPSGPNLQSRLSEYLSKTNSLNYYSKTKLQQLDNKLNSLFIKAMQGTAFTQVKGINEQLPYCLLNSKTTPIENKLLWIEKILLPKTALSNVTEILEFFKNQIPDTSKLTIKEQTILDRIRKQKIAEPVFREFMHDGLKDKSIVDSYLTLHLHLKAQTSVAELMLYLGWITDSEFKQFLFDRFLSHLENPVDMSQVDQACTMKVQLDVDPQSIPKARWYDANFYYMIGCLQPHNIQMQMVLVRLMSKVPNELINTIGWSLSQIEYKLPEVISTLSANLNNQSQAIQKASALALRSTKNISPQAENDLTTMTEDSQNNTDVRIAALNTLRSLNITNKQIHKKIMKLLSSRQSVEIREAAIATIGTFNNLDLEVIIDLAYQLNDADSKIKLAALRTFEILLPDDEFTKNKIANCLEDNDQSVARTAKDVLAAIQKKYNTKQP